MSELVEKIKEVYNKNLLKEKRSQIWEWVYSHSSTIELSKESLENMGNNELSFGFYGGSSVISEIEDKKNIHKKTIIKLGQAVGVLKILNPEGGIFPPPSIDLDSYNYSELIKKIEALIGFQIKLPPFTGNCNMIDTDYGKISDRHCHYLWVMKIIMGLYPFRSDRQISVIEIGAGMGFLGYFLSKVGYMDYTIIDLVNSNALQAYFLSKNLPDRKIILSGDVVDPFNDKYCDAIKILHTSDFENVPSGRFDIMINIDGLTEMEASDVHRYVNNDCATLFLSINHDMNNFRVIDVCKNSRILRYRYPFWLREGYTEELYQ